MKQLLFILCCAVLSGWANYPTSSDSLQFVYALDASGQIYRQQTKPMSAASPTLLLGARAQSGRALGLSQGSIFGIVYGDSQLHKRTPSPFLGQENQVDHNMAADSLVSIIGDPNAYSSTVYTFGNSGGYARVSSVDFSQATTVTTPRDSIYATPYSGKMLDGVYASGSYPLLGLYWDNMNNLQLLQWDLYSSTRTNIMPALGKYANFTKMEVNASKDTLTLFDASMKKFVHMCIASQTFVDTSVGLSDSLADFKLANNGDIIYANAVNIKRWGFYTGTVALLASITGVVGLAWDEDEVRPNISASMPTALKIPIGGLKQLSATSVQLPDANYYDTRQCLYVPIGTKHASFYSVGCALYVSQDSSVTATQKDSVLFMVADDRGGMDTSGISISYTDNIRPSLSLPVVNNIVPAYDSKTWIDTVANDANENVKFSVQAISAAAQFFPTATGDTLCTTTQEDWVAQQVMPNTSGQLAEVRMAAGFPGPVILTIVDQYKYELWSGLVSSTTAGQMKTFQISNPPYVNSGYMYSIIQHPLGNNSLTWCVDNVNTYSPGYMRRSNDLTNMKSVPFELKVLNPAQSMQASQQGLNILLLDYVADPDKTGAMETFRVIAEDAMWSTSQDISVTISANTSIPTFTPGPDVRVASRLMGDAPAASVWRWLPEAAAFPRNYVINTGIPDNKIMDSVKVATDGTLLVWGTAGKSGSQNLLIQRCYVDGTFCSSPMPFMVTLSLPPALQISPPVSITGGVAQTVGFTASDPDPLDTINVWLRPLTDAGSQLVKNSSSKGYFSLAQTFQATKSGSLSMIEVEANFAASAVDVRLLRINDLTGSDLSMSSSSSYQTVMTMTATVTAGVMMTHVFQIPTVPIDAGGFYALVLGPRGNSSSSSQIDWATNTVSVFPGTALTLDNYSHSTSLGANTDFKFRAMIDGTPINWMNTSKQDAIGRVWSLQMNPDYTIGGDFLFALQTSDNTATVAQVFGLHVYPGTAPVLEYTAGPDMQIPMSKDSENRSYIESWATMLHLPSNIWMERAWVGAHVAMDSLPYVTTSGALEFQQKADAVGTVKFASRACMLTGSACSAWDTTKIEIVGPPSLSGRLPTEVQAGVETKATLAITDASNRAFKFGLSNLLEVITQEAAPATKIATAVGQQFRLHSPGKVGEIRIYAKFSQSFVRFMIGDAADMNQVDSPKNSLVDDYAIVTPNVLQWHSLPISADVDLDTNHLYHFSLGYDDSTNTSEFGVNPNNPYNDGAFFVYAPHGTNNSPAIYTNPTNVAGATNFSSSIQMSSSSSSVIPPTMYNQTDLAFTISMKQGKPTWVDTSIIDGNVSLTLTPKATDAGVWNLLLTASNGIAAFSKVSAVTVAPQSDVTFSGLNVETRGQAVWIHASTGALAKLPAGAVVSAHIQGTGLDSSWAMATDSVVLAPLAEGAYTLDWSMQFANKTMSSGSQKFTVQVPVLTPPLQDFWYLIGFGSNQVNFSSIAPTSLVYSWDDNRAPSTNDRYVSREELISAKPGQGYWYYAAAKDSLTMPILTQMPDSLQVALQKGGTGWNMISNPWSWPIALDNTLEYWVWMADSNGYQRVTVLNPYLAAWVNTTVSRSLSIDPTPVFQDTGSKTLARRTLARFANRDQWRVQARLTSATSVDAYNELGIDPQADAGVDILDGLEPPTGMGNALSLHFEQGTVALARDLQRNIQDASWQVEMSSAVARTATLELTGIAAIQESGLRMFLVQNGSVQEVQESAPIQVALRKGSTQATLYVQESNKVAPLTGGLEGLRLVHKGSFWVARFTVPVSMVGKAAILERTSLSGDILERQSLANLMAGTNEVTLKSGGTGAGISFVRIIAGNARASGVLVAPQKN